MEHRAGTDWTGAARAGEPAVALRGTGCPRLDADLHGFRLVTEIEPHDADTLAAALHDATAAIAAADLATYDASAIRRNGIDALDDLFDLRLALHARIPEWLERGLMTRRVQAALRGVFRDGRYVTDIIGEIIHDQVPSGAPEDDVASPVEPFLPAFSGGPTHTIVNPKFGEDGFVTFRSGDVLLVRGTLANSAAIARIGDIDSQFSHVGMIHVDDDGTTNVVESLIEVGATITPLGEALSHDLTRAVLFRPRDGELGRRAANRIKSHVETARAGHAPHIPYDFTMEIEGYRKLFCSKLIRLAYATASDGALELPTFNTRLDMVNRTFFRQIGVTATETFAPADIELDPAFEIVGEWRDYRNTALIRNQDVVMDMVFHWMDQRNLQLRPTSKIRWIGWFGRAISRLPEIMKAPLRFALPSLPPRGMSRSAIEAIAMLDDVSGELTTELMVRDRDTALKTGRPLHPRDAYAALDSVRDTRKNRISYLRPAPKTAKTPPAQRSASR
ncbi:MAG: YiiX/YebB-like N1pC/P60 family cysteine hydrolase [Pseudomonadota bacterium]